MIKTRRLAAIVAADMVGYSAQMERDEEGTVRRVQDLRAGLVDPLLAEYRGRLVKTTGDGFLAEFASSIAAVNFAIDMQGRLNREPDAPRLRIGINMGDVIVEEDGDVYGEGVNVASRLEALCEPGGVLISSKIHAEVVGKVRASFEDQGEQHVKNISRLVHVFAVHEQGNADHVAQARPALQGEAARAARFSGRWTALVAAVCLVVLAGAGYALWKGLGGEGPRGTAVAASNAPTTAFDGTWSVIITCAPVESPKASGYVQRFTAVARNGALRGELGTPGTAGYALLEGQIEADGAARLVVRGLIGNPQYAVGGASGSPFGYTAIASFKDRSGSGRRVELRPCDLAFSR